MSKKKQNKHRAIDLLETAVHLLRCLSPASWIIYLIGTLPFVLGLLFFFSEMITLSFATSRCFPEAIGLVLLYLWMRSWQAIFAQQLLKTLSHQPNTPISFRLMVRQTGFQAAYAARGLALLPFAIVSVILLPWVLAYTNMLCIVDVNQPFAEAAKEARKAARFRSRQNIQGLFLLLLIWFIVFLNINLLFYLVPYLLKTLLGIETILSQSYFWINNPVIILFAFVLSYLVLDPLLKALYTVRFFFATSAETGGDLFVELRQLSLPAKRLGTRLLILLLPLFLFSTTLRAKEVQPANTIAPQTHSQTKANRLDQAISKTSQDSEFIWRKPIDPNQEKNAVSRFVNSFFDQIKKIKTQIKSFWKKIFPQQKKDDSIKNEQNSSGAGTGSLLKNLSEFLLVFLLLFLIFFLIKAFLNRKATQNTTPPKPISRSNIDMEDENIVASLLEEDEWIQLARELFEKGAFRQALRAWFFAHLAFLSRKELVIIARFKSNLDYHRELKRRTRYQPTVESRFQKMIYLFERTWYGTHEANSNEIEQMEKSLEEMQNDLKA